MTCTNYWIAASISFFVGMVMGLCGIIFREAAIGAYLVLANWVLVGIGWVLYFIGLVNYFRWR